MASKLLLHLVLGVRERPVLLVEHRQPLGRLWPQGAHLLNELAHVACLHRHLTLDGSILDVGDVVVLLPPLQHLVQIAPLLVGEGPARSSVRDALLAAHGHRCNMMRFTVLLAVCQAAIGKLCMAS